VVIKKAVQGKEKLVTDNGEREVENGKWKVDSG
jgi:hypothetical protein